MKKYFSKYCFYILTALLMSCAGNNNSDNLLLENQILRNENDSIIQLLDAITTQKIEEDNPCITGTQFLPYSSKMIGLLNNGLAPIELSIIKECQVKQFDKDQFPKFVEIRRTLTTLIIDVEIIANSCHNFLGEAEVVDLFGNVEPDLYRLW